MSAVRIATGRRHASATARLWRRWRATERGSVAAELALAAGFLLILLSAVMEFGLFLFQLLELDSAVAAGGAFARIHGPNPFLISGTTYSITGAMQSATVLGGNVCAAGLSCLPSSTCSCGGSSPVSCSRPCASGFYPTGSALACYCPSAVGLGSPVSCSTRCSSGFYPGKYQQVIGQYNVVTLVLQKAYLSSFLPNPSGRAGLVRIGQGP